MSCSDLQKGSPRACTSAGKEAAPAESTRLVFPKRTGTYRAWLHPRTDLTLVTTFS